jgi:hypothetical protein
MYSEFLRHGLHESPARVLKMAFYSVARHEFHHYLTELEALDLELKQGRSIYRPYWDHVYKKTYPDADCLEETVASLWNWDNPVVHDPVAVQMIFRDAIRANPHKGILERSRSCGPAGTRHGGCAGGATLQVRITA